MNTKNILIVEDNLINLKLVTDILLASKFNVLKATDGKTALEILEQEYSKIDLVLLDLKLPDIDGIEILKKIKADKKTEKIPVIVVSAHAMESDIRNSKEAGCVDYITKPINIKEFLSKVKANL